MEHVGMWRSPKHNPPIALKFGSVVCRSGSWMLHFRYCRLVKEAQTYNLSSAVKLPLQSWASYAVEARGVYRDEFVKKDDHHGVGGDPIIKTSSFWIPCVIVAEEWVFFWGFDLTEYFIMNAHEFLYIWKYSIPHSPAHTKKQLTLKSTITSISMIQTS